MLRIIISFIKSLAIGAVGVAMLIYLISSKFWLNFNDPLYVNNVAELTKGQIVAFDSRLTDTSFTIKNSDGSISSYFYQGSINGERVIVHLPKNLYYKMEDAVKEGYRVIAKVEKPEGKAIEHFGAEANYVKLLRNDYKGDTWFSIGFAFLVIGMSLIFPIYTAIKLRYSSSKGDG